MQTLTMALAAGLLLAACAATPPAYPVQPAAASLAALALPADLGAPLFQVNRSWTYRRSVPGQADTTVTWTTTAVEGTAATVRLSDLGVSAKVDRGAANPYGGLLGNWSFDFPAQQVLGVSDPVTVPAGSYQTVHYTYQDTSLNSAELGVEVWVDPKMGMVKAVVTRHDYGATKSPGPATYELVSTR